MNDSLPLHELVTRRRVEFADTDMEGIIHFSRFFIYMETAEHQFLNALGSSVAAHVDGKRLGWPRTAVGCEFLRPVRFEDEVEIRLLVLRKGARSITYGCEFRHRGELIARGQSTSVCCAMEEGGLRSIDIPESLAGRIEETGVEEKARWRSPIRPL
jgi:4-hydroxybenzoyl-CoA thioesterase/acyl-CoA thioester hydrolase